jgi:hypothetical protein
MNTRQILVTTIAAVWVALGIGIAVAADTNAVNPEHKFELAKKYYAECKGGEGEHFEKIRPHLKAFTDMEIMADYMSDPAKMATLMSVVNDPRTMHVMMKCSTEPVMWDTWMRNMTDYNKMMRVGMRFMNPMMYMNWMMAPMNPGVWNPMLSMMSLDSLGRWGNALVNPAFYQPMFAPMDLNWYTPRLQWMTNPQSMQPLFSMFNIPGMAPAAGAVAPAPAAAPAAVAPAPAPAAPAPAAAPAQ